MVWFSQGVITDGCYPPDDGQWYAQMASLPLPPCDTGALKEWLSDEHRIEIPILTWQGRPVLRLSVQGYNTRQEVETLIEALEAFFACHPQG